MCESCDCSKENKDKDVATGKTVTAGFIRQVLDSQAFVYYMDNDEDLSRRCLAIEGLMECCKYQDDAVHVSEEIHRIFQELVNDINYRFNTLLPKSPEEEKR